MDTVRRLREERRQARMVGLSVEFHQHLSRTDAERRRLRSGLKPLEEWDE